jgi:hypothetical protein
LVKSFNNKNRYTLCLVFQTILFTMKFANVLGISWFIILSPTYIIMIYKFIVGDFLVGVLKYINLEERTRKIKIQIITKTLFNMLFSVSIIISLILLSIR